MTKKVKAKLSETKGKIGKTNWAALKKQDGATHKNAQQAQKTRG